jgi:hypothetical protein
MKKIGEGVSGPYRLHAALAVGNSLKEAEAIALGRKESVKSDDKSSKGAK